MLFRTLSVAPPPMTRLGSSPDTPMTVTNDAESILREVYGIFQEKVVPIADLANACYTSAIEIFTILRHTSGGTSGTIKPTDGNANLIAVRCNMSCLRRFLSSTLCEMIQKTIKERLDSPSVTSILQNNSSPLLKCSLRSRRRDHHNGPKFFSPLEYIYQAVEICQDSIFNLQSSPALQSTGAPSILSLELATNYTFSGLHLCCVAPSPLSLTGLLYRKCLGEISIASVLNTKIPVTPNTEEIDRLIHQAIEHFEKGQSANGSSQSCLISSFPPSALSIFNEIANHPGATKNIPAIHYHLGSLRAMLWGYEVRKLSGDFSSQYEFNLEQSMSHYRSASSSLPLWLSLLMILSFSLQSCPHLFPEIRCGAYSHLDPHRHDGDVFALVPSSRIQVG
jgi:hypothetical protein